MVRTEDAGDLADKLRTLLADSELRERLAANAFEFAQRNFSEKAYVEHFVTMLSQTLGKRDRAGTGRNREEDCDCPEL